MCYEEITCICGSTHNAYARHCGVFGRSAEYGEEYKNKPDGSYIHVFSDEPSSHWTFKFIGEV